MAKTNKSAGKPAKSGGNNTTLLLLAGAGIAAYFMLQGGSESSATDKPANEAAGAGAYDNTPATPRPPTSIPSSLPSSVPSSVPSNVPVPAAPLVDRWGIPHLRADSMDFANGFGDAKGQLFKALSDAYGLFAEEIERLIVFDHDQSGHPFGQVENWYREDNSRLAPTIADYNRANPSTPITRRA